MKQTLSETERNAFFLAKKVQLLRLMIAQLESIIPADVALLTPDEQAEFVTTLDRLPDEIPARVIAPVRTALSISSQVA